MFTNSAIDLDNLPRISESPWHPVSKQLVIRNIIRNAFTVFVFVLIFFGCMLLGWIPLNLVFLQPIGLVLFFSVFVLFAIFGIWPVFEVPRRGFVIREHDFQYKQGILFTRTSSIPFARIQHVETSISLFDRAVNLAALKLYTAGAQSVLLGFEKDYANTLRAHIVDRIRDLDSEMHDEELPSLHDEQERKPV